MLFRAFWRVLALCALCWAVGSHADGEIFMVVFDMNRVIFLANAFNFKVCRVDNVFVRQRQEEQLFGGELTLGKFVLN